jgi:hypothetical protein
MRPASAVGFFILIVLAAPSRAATLRVPEDYPTIQAGIDQAAVGDTVLVGPGDWVDTQRRFVRINGVGQVAEAVVFTKSGVAVVGSQGAPKTRLVLQSPTATGTVVHADDGGPSTLLRGFTITGADDAIEGGSWTEVGISSWLEIDQCKVASNQERAAIFYRGRVRFSRSEITGHDTGLFDAAVFVLNGSLEMIDCQVELNAGKGIEVNNIEVPGEVKLERCVLRGQSGGAVRAEGVGYVSVTDCWFDENGGGG